MPKTNARRFVRDETFIISSADNDSEDTPQEESSNQSISDDYEESPNARRSRYRSGDRSGSKRMASPSPPRSRHQSGNQSGSKRLASPNSPRSRRRSRSRSGPKKMASHSPPRDRHLSGNKPGRHEIITRSKSRGKELNVTFVPSTSQRPKSKSRKEISREGSLSPQRRSRSHPSEDETLPIRRSRSGNSSSHRDPTPMPQSDCRLILRIHEINNLDSVRYKRDCFTAMASFNEEERKSVQVREVDWPEDLQQFFKFEWNITRRQANDFVGDPNSLAGDIHVAIKSEIYEGVGKRIWTHTVGTAELPGERDRELHNNRWMIRLQGTDLEKGNQELTYSIKIMIGNTPYVL